MATSSHAEFDRRDFLRWSLAGALGLSCSGWMPRIAQSSQLGTSTPKSRILLWMAGGPSQTDTFDLKPGHANGGPFKEIDTSVPGVRISEHLPQLAQQMADLTIVRGITSTEGDHGRATHLMMTGYKEQEAVRYPSLGALVSKELGREDHELPNFVAVSPFQFGNLGGSGFLGPQYAPLNVSGVSDDPNARAYLSVENLTPPQKVTSRMAERRFGLLEFLQRDFNDRYLGESAAAHRANYERALRMVKSQGKAAFRLEDEPAALRDAYGRNRFGQGCLLARRLVERGVPFVEVTLSQGPGVEVGWDTHLNNFDAVRTLSTVLDPAWATLMSDLRERGLLDSTLVVWMGEFGRTPVINPQNGRDHFPVAWTAVLGGAGINNGMAYGKTNDSGMEVVDKPVKAPEFIATICSALGVDYEKENMTPEGRPISIVERGTSPVADLVKSPSA